MTWKIVGIVVALFIVVSLITGIRDLIRSGKTVDRRVLFSSIEGVLRSGETPVAGATIVREWRFAEQSVQQKDEAVTDSEGRFSFPEIAIETQRGVLGQFLAQQFIVSQRMEVMRGDSAVTVWDLGKQSPLSGEEFRMADFSPAPTPLAVIIDLESPYAARTFGEGGRVLIGHTISVAGVPLVREAPLNQQP